LFIVALAIAMVGMFLAWVVIQSQRERANHLVAIEAEKIEQTLSLSFDYTNRILSNMGQQIADHGADDLEFILENYRSKSKVKYKEQEFFSWSLFDWVDSNGFQLLNSRKGIHETPPDMNHRDYAQLSPRYPWTLQVSVPALGNPSKQWVVPAGTGITDDQGNYLGAIVVGFNVAKLTSYLETIVDDDVSFVILDQHYNIVSKSTDTDIENSSTFFRDNVDDRNFFNEESGTLEYPVAFKDIEYTYFYKFSDYPYIVLAGFNQVILAKWFGEQVVPVLLEYTVIGTVMFLLFFLIEVKMRESNRKLAIALNEARESNRAKDEFLSKFHTEQRQPLYVISKLANSLSDEYGHIDQDIIDSAEIIKSEVQQLSGMVTAFLNLSEVEVQPLIEKCIMIKKDKVNSKELDLAWTIQDELPAIYTDSLRLTMIVLGIMQHALLVTPKGEKVELRVSKEADSNGEDHLVIQIKDTGFPMDEKIRSEIFKGFYDSLQETDKTDVSVEQIRDLVNLLEGSVRYEKTSDDHNLTVVKIPYSNPKDRSKTKQPPKAENVVSIYD